MTAIHPVFGTEVPRDWILMRVDDIKAPEPWSCVAGPFGSNISSKYFADDGVPVIRGGNLTDDLTPFVPTGFAYVTEERARSYKAQHVRAGGLVFTCWGTIGQVGRIPEDGPYVEYIISNKQLKLRPDPARTDSRFLYYYFANPQMVQHIRGRAVGSAVPGINLGILKDLPVVLPPLLAQRKIAAILSGYDDLIENNNRRIKLVEEMAQRIYREWFVDFRYPGHEAVPLVESELGPIPQGWPVRKLRDVATVSKGLSYKGEFLTDDGKPMANLKCFMVGGGFRRDGTKPYSGGFKPDHAVWPGDLIMANTDLTQAGGVIGSPAIVPRRGFEQGGLISHHLFAIRPTNALLSSGALFHILADPRFRTYARGRASGTTVLGFRTFDCEDYRFALPNGDVIGRFASIVDPALQLLESLHESSEAAAAARDYLLPRLMSGESDIDGLDIEIPDTE